jgi:hypothetical protein
VHIIQKKYSITRLISTRPAYIRWAVYYTVLVAIVFFHVSGSKQFIYFQF